MASALCGAQRRGGQIIAGGWPDCQQCVVSELNHIAAVDFDQVEDLPKGGVQDAGQLFNAGGAATSQALGQRGETRDIGKQTRCLQWVAGRSCQWDGTGGVALKDQRGNVAGKCVKQRLA